MLYNTLILPHISYGIMVWGYQRNRLNKIQKKAIRIITSNKYNSHTEPLFKQLNMLKLEDLLKLQQLKFYSKFNEGSLPVYLQNWDITPNARVHNYNTRELGCIHTFKVKHEFAIKCLKYNLPKLMNDTPKRVKDKINTHSLKGLINYGKNDMIHKYSIIQHCYKSGSGVAEWARELTGERTVNGSSPAAVKTFRFASELWQFRLPRQTVQNISKL